MTTPFEDAFGALLTGDVAALRAALAADPSIATRTGEDSLLVAACHVATDGAAIPAVRLQAGHLEAVRVLLDAGADPAAATAEGWTGVHLAVMGGQPELLDVLVDTEDQAALDRRLDGRLLGQDGGTPFALAAFYAHTGLARRLAEVGGAPNPDNLRGAAAIGADLDRFVGDDGGLVPDAWQGTAFQRPNPGFPAVAPPRPDERRQHTVDDALTWASRNGQVEAMSRLVTLGANVDANPYRGTALLWAVYGDRADAATWLLDAGADPDLRHDFGGVEHGRGAVAMHLAAQYGSLACLRVLLDAGADTTIRDAAYDATPLEWAEHAGTEGAAQVLRAHRAG